MAYFQGAVRSFTLQMDTNINVILPYDYYAADGEPGKYDKVLYLLHGLKQNADAWPRMSSVERYANYYGYAVVMPEVQRSFYTDMAMGAPYFTYLTEELPAILHAMFRLPTGREKTFAAGLSMGGYGALKCALSRPDLFAGAMSFSSGFFMLDDPERLMKVYYNRGELQGVIGLDLQRGEKDDMELLARSFPDNIQKPRLYIACGTEDPLYPNNTRMRDMLLANAFPLHYEEWAGGHTWIFWDAALEKAMRYMADRD